MYNKNEKEFLNKITHQFLQNDIGIDELEQLKNVIQYHQYIYYVENNATISDIQFDLLFKKLIDLENSNPSRITTNSPTQRVGNSLHNTFQETVAHLVPMLSLENSYNATDLLDFERKVKEYANIEEVAYCVEPKFDGASISLVYENNQLLRAITRGDGIVGEDITQNIKLIKSIPIHINLKKYGIKQMEIRGEVLYFKDKFNAINEQLIKQQLPTLANPRNAAAGSLRIKDPIEAAKRNLDAFLYHISYILYDENATNQFQLSTHIQSLELLYLLGFRTAYPNVPIFNAMDNLIDYTQKFEGTRDDLPFEIDGLVIKVNNLSTQEKLGMTTHHPRWAIAYKFKARQATTQIENVEFQIGRTGAVTPVAKLTPVKIGGVQVSSISIHNQDYIQEKDLRIGDWVIIERAGDVIPQIVESLKNKRNGTEKIIEFPTHCLVCNAILKKEIDESVLRCTNYQCSAQVVERIIHFASKDAMDIQNLGEANILKFYNLGFLKTITDIYKLPYNEISNLPGFGSKSVDRLKEAIEQTKQQPLYRLIYALGIRFIGETTAKSLAKKVHHLLEFKNFSLEDLQKIEDIGIKTSLSIEQFFKDEKNILLLQELENVGVSLINQQKEETNSGNLIGQSFLFTGTLIKLKRNDAEAMVEKQGGHIVSAVSSKLNYLVVGENAGSKLEKAKKLNSIHIINEDEFLKMIE